MVGSAWRTSLSMSDLYSVCCMLIIDKTFRNLYVVGRIQLPS